MSYRILVIDDDPWMSSTLSLFLTGELFEVVIADDEATAHERLDAATPDVILLKLTLGGADRGWDLGHEIRAQFHDIPIIVLAEGNDPVEELLARALEADGYLRKPYELFSLVENIDRVLCSRWTSRKRKHQKLRRDYIPVTRE